MSEASPPSGKPAPSDLERSDAPPPGRMHPDEEEASAVLSAVQYFAGPLPPPQVIQGYDQALPGLADRVVTMAEEEARHRREIERERLKRDSKLELRGQVFGFSIAIISFVVAGILIAMDRPLYGMATVVAAAAGLSGLFVWSRNKLAPKRVLPPEPSKGG